MNVDSIQQTVVVGVSYGYVIAYSLVDLFSKKTIEAKNSRGGKEDKASELDATVYDRREETVKVFHFSLSLSLSFCIGKTDEQDDDDIAF